MAENSRSKVDVSHTVIRGNIDRVFQARDRCKLLPQRRSAAAQSFHALNICSDEVKRKSRNFFDPFRSCHVVRVNKFAVSELERKARLDERSFAAFHTILHLDDNGQLSGVLIADERLKPPTGRFKTRASEALEQRYYCCRALGSRSGLELATREAARG